MATKTRTQEDIARANISRWITEQWADDTAFCEAFRISRPNLQNWKRGIRGARAAWIEKVAAALGRTMAEVYTEF